MTNDYCQLADIKAEMPEAGLSGTTDYDAALTQAITDASRLIDDEVARWPGFFYPSTDDQTRYFDGSGELDLQTDEIVSITSVSVAEQGDITQLTDWSATDYITYPLNHTAKSKPITRLSINRFGNTDKAAWYGFPKAVKIVGVFGYSATPPAQIARACRIQAIRYYMRAKQAWQDAGAAPELGQMVYIRRLDPDVQEIIRRWQIENMI